MKERGKRVWRVGVLKLGGGAGNGEGGLIAIPRALSSCYYMEKKSLLLSVCKGNENLMRLDFFFSPFSICSHSTQDSTTGSLRRSMQDGGDGWAFILWSA